MPSICFQDNSITIDMDNDVKYIDIGDEYLRLNKSTTKEPWSFCSSTITVYYKDDTGHPERKFPAKDGANFPAGETITITGGGLRQTKAFATDPEGQQAVWGF